MILFFNKLLGVLLAAIYFPIVLTLGLKREMTNFQYHWERAGRPLVRCSWHEHIIAFVYRLAFRKMCVMASKSKDGEIISSALKTLGFKVVRGSSTRGGSEALRGMLRAFNDGWNISLMVDGPKGPHRKIKPGILILGSMTGAPIVPTVISVKWFFRVKSWDRMIIPVPFSPAVELNGKPIMVPRSPSSEELDKKIIELEEEFNRLEIEARDYFVTVQKAANHRCQRGYNA